METNGTSEKSLCPICNKEFSLGQIQFHADKCLFLNSESIYKKRGSKGDSSFKSSSKKHQTEKQLDGEEDATSQLSDNNNHQSLHADKCLFQNSETVYKKKRGSKGDSSFKSSSKKHKIEEQLDDGDTPSQPKDNLSQVKIDFKKPLAEIMRPSSLNEFIGQKQVMNESGIFRTLIEQGNIPSMILWGPPGCGKTTLAHIISQKISDENVSRFTKLSAVTSGVNDVKEVVKVAKNELNLFKKKTFLFMDEIHRFNKAQQDIFLPYVESGLITLIGATTENPSFSLNSTLLSRCRVFVFEKLTVDEVFGILQNASDKLGATIYDKTMDPNDATMKYLLDRHALQWLAEMCDGDARYALNSLQIAIESAHADVLPIHISLEAIKEGIKRSHMLYDRKGEEHYNTISALHKSIRASDDNAALYWLARMLEGGEDPMFIARRLVRAASEDVGVSDPMALTLAVSAMHGCQMIGMPECEVLLAQVTVYLARTHKSQEIYHALERAKRCVKSHKGSLPSVPLHLRNAPTKLMKNLGYGHGYNTGHKDESNLSYLPKELECTFFFRDDS